MGGKRHNIDELRSEYIGKTFNYLTVTNVIRNDSNIITFVCTCKCGAVRHVHMYKVLSYHTTSCGCYKNSKEYKEKNKQWLKDDEKLLARNAKCKQWCNDNREKVAERGKRHSKWFKDHKEIVIEQGKRHSRWYKDNPDKVTDIGKKISQWYKDNPEKVAEKANNFSMWCKEHQEEVAAQGRRHSEKLRSNPEKLAEQGRQYSQWVKDNHEAHVLSIQKFKDTARKKRLNTNFSKLLDVVHPDYIDDLLNGLIKSDSIIKTKCPMCGNYVEHSFNNVFIQRSEDFRCSKPPLCFCCKQQIVSSNAESEIADFISTFYSGECIRNSRKIISPFELDLYYPEKKIAIEFNGDYWHSEEFKQKDYHYNKFIACLNSNTLLISIFESEWRLNSNIIKNYIKDSFNGVQNDLSFKDAYTMNNNYPALNVVSNDIAEHVSSFYNYRDLKVFTCGYSVLKYALKEI